jgi:hypothetical protein
MTSLGWKGLIMAIRAFKGSASRCVFTKYRTDFCNNDDNNNNNNNNMLYIFYLVTGSFILRLPFFLPLSVLRIYWVDFVVWVMHVKTNTWGW